MLHLVCQQIWKTQQWPLDCNKSVIVSIPKKGSAKECSNYCIITLISQASKIMLWILQCRLQQYVNWELPDVQDGLRKGREVKWKLLSHVQILATPWTVAWQALLSMEFSRQQNCSGLPFPSSGDLRDPGIKGFLHCRQILCCLSRQGSQKAEKPEITLPTSTGSQKKQENSRKDFCFIDYTKAFDCVDHNKLCGKFFKR